jgi:hypothetical protein
VWNLDQGNRSIRAGIRLRMAGLLHVWGVAVIAPSFMRWLRRLCPVPEYPRDE